MGRVHRSRRSWRPLVAASATAVLAACSVPGWVNPVNWFGDDEPELVRSQGDTVRSAADDGTDQVSGADGDAVALRVQPPVDGLVRDDRARYAEGTGRRAPDEARALEDAAQPAPTAVAAVPGSVGPAGATPVAEAELAPVPQDVVDLSDAVRVGSPTEPADAAMPATPDVVQAADPLPGGMPAPAASEPAMAAPAASEPAMAAPAASEPAMADAGAAAARMTAAEMADGDSLSSRDRPRLADLDAPNVPPASMALNELPTDRPPTLAEMAYATLPARETDRNRSDLDDVLFGSRATASQTAMAVPDADAVEAEIAAARGTAAPAPAMPATSGPGPLPAPASGVTPPQQVPVTDIPVAAAPPPVPLPGTAPAPQMVAAAPQAAAPPAEPVPTAPQAPPAVPDVAVPGPPGGETRFASLAELAPPTAAPPLPPSLQLLEAAANRAAQRDAQMPAATRSAASPVVTQDLGALEQAGPMTVQPLLPTGSSTSQKVALRLPGTGESGMAPSSGQLAALSPPTAGVSMLAATVEFPEGSSQLSGEARRQVADIASQFRNTGGTIRVIGHASRHANVNDTTERMLVNFQVSMARAQAVAAALERQGVPPARIFVGAQGDSRPLADEVTIGGRTVNQRAEIFLDY